MTLYVDDEKIHSLILLATDITPKVLGQSVKLFVLLHVCQGGKTLVT